MAPTKLYFLFDDLDFGKYEGQSVQDIFKIDPAYIDSCLCRHQENFSILYSDLEKLKILNPEFTFSEKAINNAKDAEIYFDSEDENGSLPEDKEEDID